MFIYSSCTTIGDNLFDEKISIDKKEEYINKYKLENKGNIKEYWINNVCIIDRNGDKTYKYIKDVSVEYENNMLLQEIDVTDCIPFNFYKTDIEYEYELYESTINGIVYQLKKYDNFITYSYISENKI
tara:strand:- start:2011 stop:2394 length:384 start_codon:yes stop_codon:yes gene_type:complete